MDDTVSSFRRRLELFRELTLPMLKALDGDGRLTIVSSINSERRRRRRRLAHGMRLATTCGFNQSICNMHEHNHH